MYNLERRFIWRLQPALTKSRLWILIIVRCGQCTAYLNLNTDLEQEPLHRRRRQQRCIYKTRRNWCERGVRAPSVTPTSRAVSLLAPNLWNSLQRAPPSPARVRRFWLSVFCFVQWPYLLDKASSLLLFSTDGLPAPWMREFVAFAVISPALYRLFYFFRAPAFTLQRFDR